jgi:glycosyltransferase involved in cell wall biosynthesis
MPHLRVIGILVDIFYSFYYIARIRPDVILVRGASRSLAHLSLFAKWFGVRLIFFGASDVNFQYEKEGIGRKHDRVLYRFGLRNTEYFVAQNQLQYDLLVNEYKKKNVIIIPNIWLQQDNSDAQRNMILWVANFRQLKRPQWFIQLAKDFPQYKFVMVGAAIDKQLFDACKDDAEMIPNIEFMGRQSFSDVNKLFTQAKCFICTSEYEGFPNTFLQSWSNSIPIISTVDPSNLVVNKNLGIFVSSYEELKNAICIIEQDKDSYQEIQCSIKSYFISSHDAVKQYELLKKLL